MRNFLDKISFPVESRPFERAILIVYATGITDPTAIASVLNYKRRDAVYDTLHRYEDLLPSLRAFGHDRRLIGKAWIGGE
jgi:hypothetical protein